ncbi:MAG: AAA family ATPase, partial [Candidatus Binatia bacterium]
MRPSSLDEFVGQQHLLGPGKLLRELINAGQLHSLLFWGPPGCGKTTLAQILATATGAHCVHFSAVSSGVKDLKKIIDDAARLYRLGKSTVLFVDEIHHFNKAQQDIFLPHVEQGTIILIGATTENPSFQVIGPLLSRCQVLSLYPLSPEEIGLITDRALQGNQKGLGALALRILPEARQFLIEQAHGDARVALNTLETTVAMLE